MKKVDIEKITDNFIYLIGKEWMLISAGNKDKFNMMTANWGSIGFLWNKPVVSIFVRPERYTYNFIEQQDYFTLSFMGEEYKDVHKICGNQSGRDINKIVATGLTPIFTDNGNPVFEESRLTIECKKLYATNIRKEDFIDMDIYKKWYGTKGGDHKMYVGEILDAWSK